MTDGGAGHILRLGIQECVDKLRIRRLGGQIPDVADS